MSEKFMRTCKLCQNQYQYGPHIYDGIYIKCYDIHVCLTCYKSNRDGWNHDAALKLIAHLKKNGLPIPDTNDKGWLPRE